MILARFDLYRYRLPLTAPLALKGAVLRRREGLLLRLQSDAGAVGWGEASPLPGFSPEGPAEAAQQLLALRPDLLGRELTCDWIDPDGAFARAMDERDPAASARFGIELAAWDLLAAAQGKTLPGVLTPQPRATVSLNGLLTGTGATMLDDARRMRAAGYRAVKLKVGRGSVEEEIDRVRALAGVLGPDVALRLDANRAWRREDAVAFAEGLAGLPVAYLEEPLADPAQLADFVAQTGLPVALDESLVGLPAEALADHAYARAVVLKPTLLGGLVPALRMARAATHLGITPVLSAAFETGLGLRGLVALAAALPDVPAGLDTYRRLADDVLTPRLDVAGSTLDVPAMMNVERSIRTDLLEGPL